MLVNPNCWLPPRHWEKQGQASQSRGEVGGEGGSAPGGEGAEGAGVPLKILVRVQMSQNGRLLPYC